MIDGIETLSNRWAFSVLKYLGEHSDREVTYSELQQIVVSYNTLSNLIAILEDDQLVSSRRIMTPYKTNLVKLTALGKAVADKILEIDEILNAALNNEDGGGGRKLRVNITRPQLSAPCWS